MRLGPEASYEPREDWDAMGMAATAVHAIQTCMEACGRRIGAMQSKATSADVLGREG